MQKQNDTKSSTFELTRAGVLGFLKETVGKAVVSNSCAVFSEVLLASAGLQPNPAASSALLLPRRCYKEKPSGPLGFVGAKPGWGWGGVVVPAMDVLRRAVPFAWLGVLL